MALRYTLGNLICDWTLLKEPSIPFSISVVKRERLLDPHEERSFVPVTRESKKKR